MTSGEAMRCLCLATVFAVLSTGGSGAVACDAPHQLQGFRTCADIGKAEEEGALVVYSTDPEAAAEQELAKFHALFPKIKPAYLRLQAGALYANLLAERVPRKPHAFDSYVQQFDRLVNGQDKVALTAQYSGDGAVAAPQPWGIVKEAPCPAAAQLFMDWFLGVPGQTANAELLFTWHAFEQTHAQFVHEWDKITGLH
jgi:hypothetical protein